MHVNTRDKLDIVNAARLTLGYIFFELSSYRAAIRYLMDVSPDFDDYPEALLALGWAAYKLQDYETAQVALNHLIEDHPNFHNLEEAYFVLGQCYVNLGRYDAALDQYTKILDKTPKARDVESVLRFAENEIANQEKRLEALKTDLLLLESRLLETIPVRGDDGLAQYAEGPRREIRQSRQIVLQRIVDERQEFETLSQRVSEVKRQIEKVERQRDWRAYAEYGRARALYLKGIAGQ